MSVSAERAVGELESVANFLRGLSLDPAIPDHAKEAIQYRIGEIDKLVEEAWEDIE